MNPNHLKLLKKAQGLELAGRAAEAAQAYSEFLAREPRHTDGWSDFAGQLMQLGRLEEAEEACQTALRLDAGHLSAQINLGCLLMHGGSLEASESRFRAVLKAEPRRFDARLCLAECLIKMGDLDGAQKVLDAAYQLGPIPPVFAGLKGRHAEQWTLLGSARLERKQLEAAFSAFQKALQLHPSDFAARANLGAVRMAQGRLDEALGMFQRLLAEHPGEERARLLLITCLARKNDGALREEIAQAIQQKPSSFTTHRSVMGVHYFLGDWAAYRAEIARYRTFYPKSAFADFEEGCVDLLFGDMARGWKLYEGRLGIPKEVRPRRVFSEPGWDGSPFAGKTLLLWPEQGFGDTLMALRYLPAVKALGGRVLLEVQPALASLAGTASAPDQVIPSGQPLPGFDLQASLMSLPHLFKTDLSTVPAAIPYLETPADPPHRRDIEACLAKAPGKPRIGLVWAGFPGHTLDHERSLSPSALAPLADLSGAAWFSFQVGRGEELPPLPGLTVLAPCLGDFSDTAYALGHMDLLITVDTSVAHLAGALGIPTWLLLPFAPDFRWMLERRDSPWYPTFRLYRQPAYGDWASVMRQVAADLGQGF